MWRDTRLRYTPIPIINGSAKIRMFVNYAINCQTFLLKNQTGIENVLLKCYGLNFFEDVAERRSMEIYWDFFGFQFERK